VPQTELSDGTLIMDVIWTKMLFEPMTTTFKTISAEMIQTGHTYMIPELSWVSIQVDDSRETEGVILIIP